MKLENVDSSEALRFAFFLILLVYVGILLIKLPGQPAGLFPTIVLPVIAVLIVYRLSTIAFSSTGERIHNTVTSVIDLSSLDLLSADSFKGDPLEADSPGIDVWDVMWISVWPILAVLLVYVFGHLVGGFVFTISFLFLYGEISILRSTLLAVFVSSGIWLLASTLNLAIWEGAWTEIIELA